MECDCLNLDKIEGNKIVEYEKNYLIQIKVDGEKWRTLFKCQYCNSYWEERDAHGRFGVDIDLIKVTEKYAKENYAF